jgi:hypothetical protein
MAKTTAKQDAISWADTLRDAIRKSDLSLYAIAQACSSEERQMPQSMLTRFMAGKSINLETAERVGRVVGVELRAK